MNDATRSRIRILGAVFGIVVLLAVVGTLLFGVHRVPAGTDAPEVDGVLTHDLFAEVLAAGVEEDGVDYDAILGVEETLREYAALVGAVGPRSRPDAFPTEDHELAWAINAYNALTLLAVVHHWPISSVHDVHGPLAITPGLGFFFALHVRIDRRWRSLNGIENKLIRPQFGDARIHAAINCASVGCPALEPVPFVADGLDDRLDAAAQRFASPPHVGVDHDREEIRLSQIYNWYDEDFEADAEELTDGDTVLDWIMHYAPDDVAAALAEARDADYAVVHTEYDWSLNRATR